MKAKDGTCRCGHSHQAHEHYRRGSDCGICGADGCAKFRLAPNQPSALAEAITPASNLSTESATAETA